MAIMPAASVWMQLMILLNHMNASSSDPSINTIYQQVRLLMFTTGRRDSDNCPKHNRHIYMERLPKSVIILLYDCYVFNGGSDDIIIVFLISDLNRMISFSRSSMEELRKHRSDKLRTPGSGIIVRALAFQRLSVVWGKLSYRIFVAKQKNHLLLDRYSMYHYWLPRFLRYSGFVSTSWSHIQ